MVVHKGSITMDFVRRINVLLLLLLLSFIGFVSIINVERTYAVDGTETCAVTPDQIDGQGFRVSSQGFRVSSQGFRVSSQGFRVSSFGFRVSSQSDLDAIIHEIVNNPVTPKLLVDDLPDIITGSGFNSQPVYLLVVDDFSAPDSHGFKVRKTMELLISAIDANDGDPSHSPNINIINVDIAPVDYDASLIAGSIKNAVDSLSNPNNSHVVVNMSFGLVPCNDASTPTLVDSESGESFTVTKGFNFGEYQSGPPVDRPFEPVSPILECIVIRYKDGEGSEGSEASGFGFHGHHSNNIEGYTAYFGYYNPNSYGVEPPAGFKNMFTGWEKDLGQPTKFAPGRQHFVFSADFKFGGLIWHLGHKKAIAWKKSPVCEGEIPEPSPQIFPDGFGIDDYATEVLGIPQKFVDEYYDHLFKSAVETDPFSNLDTLMQGYLQLSHDHATDGDPNTNFALIPIASAGNFRPTFGGQPLKPAAYDSVIAVSASVGDTGIADVEPILFWQLSHDGNILAPGVSVALAYDAEGAVTDIGAGTSHSAPFVSVLSSLWLTYPGACNFDSDELPPLANLSQFKDSNAFFTENVLDCHFNLPPAIDITFGGSSVDENTWQLMGTMSDPNGDAIELSTESTGVLVRDNEDGTWSLRAKDNITPQGPQTIIVKANDGRGGITEISVVLTILNVAPTATLEVDKTTVNVLETATLTLIDATDKSNIDAESLMYVFDCDTSDAFVNEPSGINSYGCAYTSPGTFAATATILDKDGGSNTYDTEITVVSSDPKTCYAESVVSYIEGRRKDGRKIDPERTDPEKALGEPQNNDTQNYVSLGFAWKNGPAGSIILAFGEHSITNQNGTEPDVRVWETTYRDQHRHWFWYPETVEVYASADGENWVYIGKTSDKDQAFDLGSLSHANFIKLVDITNRWRFGRQADAFDVDAVEGFVCEIYEE